MWEKGKSVTNLTKAEELIEQNPSLANVGVVQEDEY